MREWASNIETLNLHTRVCQPVRLPAVRLPASAIKLLGSLRTLAANANSRPPGIKIHGSFSIEAVIDSISKSRQALESFTFHDSATAAVLPAKVPQNRSTVEDNETHARARARRNE